MRKFLTNVSSLSAASLVSQPALFAERYRTERLLGQGGMGAVYAVFDPVTQRRMALKLLAKQVDAQTIGLFEREYQTLASLNHPRIVGVFDYGRCAEGAYYTMELLEGSDLSAAAPMPWREVCACLRDVASILGVLHVRGLVHRDLSPRNLWRTQDGRLTLIDFGALAPFGVARQVMGTPPFVPPEALRAQPLDARSDLYALGALGYWLTTSVQAYPAKSLGELPALWTTAPASPGNLATLLEGQQQPIPAALDSLLLALLSLDPEQRPSSTAELIDRLSVIADLPPEGHEGAAQGYLHSNVFVGRLRERERVVHHLKEAQRGSPQALLIEGAAGLGRTRLLAEMAIAARVAGATTLSLDARQGPRPYAMAAALIEQLTVISPAARKVAEAHAELLAPLSASLRTTLGRSSQAALQTRSEERLRTQTALQETLLAACKEQLLAVFVDDLHALDEESQALLAVLARAGKGHQLLLVTSVLREGASELSSLAQSLRNVSALFGLLPLTNSETLSLLRSVFGNAPYLERLAERLQRMSDGNPSYCLELAQHLVRVGAARYSDGMWVLPTDLASAQLPKSRSEGFIARLAQLTPAARKLAAQISVPHHGPLPVAVCLATSPEAPSLLVELLQAGVLQESSAGYGFTHNMLEDTLAKELTAAQRSEAHLRFAQVLLQRSADRSDRLSAGLHLMQAGEVARGEQLQRDCAREVLDGGDLDMLRRDAPFLRQGLELLDLRGREDHALALHLTALACSGYYADRSYAVRYGDRCVATLERILALPLARKLRRFLGARLSLFVALFVAGVGMAKRRSYALTLKVTVRYFFSAIATLAGTAAVCIDSKTSHRYADALAPLADAFGKGHAASYVYAFARYLGHRSEDRSARTMHMGRALVERFSGGPIRNLPDAVRENFRVGALFSLGVTLSWRDTPECLRVANALDKSTPFYRMAADQLRSNFYGTQGDAAEAARYRQRVETHAIQLGSAWQVETWAPADMLKTALLTQDALGMKRAAQELSRLAEEIPSFGQHARTARAAYLLLRNKPGEAAALLAHDDEPLAIVGWARVRGLLARAHNGLGQHARAREICTDALARMDPEDLTFPAMNLNVQVELALAEAGLGDFASARATLEQLLRDHEPNRGPLTMAALHDAYARVALREQDFAACSEQLAKLDLWVLPTGISSLIERCDLLKRELTHAQRAGDAPEGELRLLSDDGHLMTRVQLILTHTGSLVTERASKGLQIAVELSGADDGFIVLPGGQSEAMAYLNEMPTSELLSWAHERLMAAYVSDETAAVEHVDSLIDLNLNLVDGVHYCVAPLWARRDNQDMVVAALALGFRKGAPRLPGADVLRVIAGHLADPLPGND